MKIPSFVIGQTVRVLSLRKKGIITKLRRGNYYEVEVGSLSLILQQNELQEVTQKKVHAKSRSVYPTKKKKHSNATYPSLDLHGLTTNPALERVENMLNHCLLNAIDEFDVIHGIGLGTLKRATHGYLSRQSQVSHFALLLNNPGITRVYL